MPSRFALKFVDSSGRRLGAMEVEGTPGTVLGYLIDYPKIRGICVMEPVGPQFQGQDVYHVTVHMKGSGCIACIMCEIDERMDLEADVEAGGGTPVREFDANEYAAECSGDHGVVEECENQSDPEGENEGQA